MTLYHFLKSRNLITGPITKGKVNTSHSAMEVIKKAWCGQEQFAGGEEFLHFGNALHERCLEDNHKRQVPIHQVELLASMASIFKAHKIIAALMKGAVCEKKFMVTLNGVKVVVILDIRQIKKRLGADLKTTTAKSLADCIKKAIEYGYFRQGLTYIKAAKLNHFFFVFISKETAPQVFILDVAKFPAEMKYAEQELEWLLYMFKNYGKPIL